MYIGTWFGPGLIVGVIGVIVLVVALVAVFSRGNNQLQDTIPPTEEEIAAKICPNLLAEVFRLRVEVKELRDIIEENKHKL